MIEKNYWEKLKKEDPEKYKILREKSKISQRIYKFINRDKMKLLRKKYYDKHRKEILEYNKKYYEKMKKEDPEKYKARMKKIYSYIKKRYDNEPEFRKEHLEYGKRYRARMKIEDPERYKQMFQHFSVNKTISGYRCLNCGFSIISSMSGKRRRIKCPKCRKLYCGNELERIKIPRNIPKGYVKVPSSTNYQLPSDTMENLRNFCKMKVKIKEEKISDDDIFDAVDKFEK
jgi:hypothetical protein